MEENKKMRDVDRQFSKMKSECIKDIDCRLCSVVLKMTNVEKRNKNYIQAVEENTIITEGISVVLQE